MVCVCPLQLQKLSLCLTGQPARYFSPVYDKGLPRDEARAFGSEKRHGFGNFFRLAEPLQGDRLHNLPALFL